MRHNIFSLINGIMLGFRSVNYHILQQFFLIVEKELIFLIAQSNCCHNIADMIPPSLSCNIKFPRSFIIVLFSLSFSTPVVLMFLIFQLLFYHLSVCNLLHEVIFLIPSKLKHVISPKDPISLDL